MTPEYLDIDMQSATVLPRRLHRRMGDRWVDEQDVVDILKRSGEELVTWGLVPVAPSFFPTTYILPYQVLGPPFEADMLWVYSLAPGSEVEQTRSSHHLVFRVVSARVAVQSAGQGARFGPWVVQSRIDEFAAHELTGSPTMDISIRVSERREGTHRQPGDLAHIVTYRHRWDVTPDLPLHDDGTPFPDKPVDEVIVTEMVMSGMTYPNGVFVRNRAAFSDGEGELIGIFSDTAVAPIGNVLANGAPWRFAVGDQIPPMIFSNLVLLSCSIPDPKAAASRANGVPTTAVNRSSSGRWAFHCWLHASENWLMNWRRFILAAVAPFEPPSGSEPPPPPERL